MNNLSISTKIALGFAVILIIFTFQNFLSIRNITQLNNDSQWVRHTQEVLEKIETVIGDLKDAETGQRGFLITGIDNYLEPYDLALKDVTKHLDELEVLTNDNPQMQQLIYEVRILISNKLDELKETINLRKNSGFEAAKTIVMNDSGKLIMDEIRVLFSKMTNEENILLIERSAQDTETSSFFIKTTILFSILIYIIVLGLIIYFTRIISTPLKNLSSIAQEISLGDLTTNISESTKKDEIGVLTNSFKTMQQNLRKRADEAEEIANGNLTLKITPLSDKDSFGIAFLSMITNLSSQMNDINIGANTLSSSSIELMTMMSQLSSSYSATAESVSETSITIEELKQSIEISTQRATQVVDSGQKLSMISQEGNDSVEKTINAMHKIKEQMESIASIVIQLSEKSQTIGKIANTVNDIAEQSNLLAVNASIEAAKAGEHGKGFSVVAQEIKNLAKLSKESTIEIRTVLMDIQKQISISIMAIEEGGKVIGKGIELSNTANEVITLLSESVQLSVKTNLQIAASSKEQHVGMDQISLAMKIIKESTELNSEGNIQTEKSIYELKELGEKLLELLNHYKLK